MRGRNINIQQAEMNWGCWHGLEVSPSAEGVSMDDQVTLIGIGDQKTAKYCGSGCVEQTGRGFNIYHWVPQFAVVGGSSSFHPHHEKAENALTSLLWIREGV